MLSRLHSSRQAFYAELLPAAIETMQRYTEEPGPEEITDVGTLNGSLPQLSAPRMKPLDGVQKVIPLGFPVVAPDGLDEVAGAAVTALPCPGLTCGGLT